MKCETGFHANIVIQITLTVLEGKKSLNKQTIMFLASTICFANMNIWQVSTFSFQADLKADRKNQNQS